jgi:hypothetical protein
MDCETFEIIGQYEMDRGKQDKHYDFWWNLPQDYMVSSEWGLPPQFENGIVPEDLLSNKYGHSIHFWDLRARKNIQTMDWKFAPPMIPPNPMASAVSSSTQPTCRVRSLRGGAMMTAFGNPKRRSQSILFRPMPMICQTC